MSAGHPGAGRPPAARQAPEPGDRRIRRLPVLALVAVLLLAGGLASRLVRPTAAPAAAAKVTTSLADMAAPATASASSWYCSGATGPASSTAKGTLYLVNASAHPVKGTLTAYDDKGHRATAGITVPALGETTAGPGTMVPGAWVASRVDLNGGGVAVSQLVAGPTGWSMAPCSTEASTDWYFATGATTGGDRLYVSLFNPTSGTAVVDLTFVTGNGSVQPAPFQGMVIAPDAVVTATVGAYVQDQSSVAAVVRARSGRVVATELQVHSANGQRGVSLRLGAPQPSPTWYLPSSEDAVGGTSQLAVFNPTQRPEHVKVTARLPSGPLTPFQETVAPRSSWTLGLSGQTRIPAGTPYTLAVDATGGPGVVVARVSAAPSPAPAPQWGAVSAVAAAATASPTGRWTIPNPALGAARAEPGAQPTDVVLLNPSGHTVRASVSSLGSGSLPLPGSPLRIGPHGVAVVPAKGIGAGGLAPLRVTADGPLAVVEDVAPAGTVGVVTGTAVPQA